MSAPLPPPVSALRTMRLLWQAARTRARGRLRRQRQLMRRKTGSESNALSTLGMILMILFMGMIHGWMAWIMTDGVKSSQLLEFEREHRDVMLVNYASFYLKRLPEMERARRVIENQLKAAKDGKEKLERRLQEQKDLIDRDVKSFCRSAAMWRKHNVGGDEKVIRAEMEAHYVLHGVDGFRDADTVGLASLSGGPRTLPTMFWPFATLVLLWWLVVLVCQGEGLELDIQRRRHPMWEWLFSHPVRPVAAFAAELLAPMMANPIYYGAPIFWFVVLVQYLGIVEALLASVAIGAMLAAAASAVGKSLEITAMLRLSPRTRGAAVGFMSWMGYAGMMAPIFIAASPAMKASVVRVANACLSWVPSWPARWLLMGWDDAPVMWQIIACAALLAAGMMALAFGVVWFATRRGLSGAEGAGVPTQPMVLSDSRGGWFQRHPLYRKELLWFWRDKSAVIQAVLIPLTIGGMQAFNFRGLLEASTGRWSGICGVAVICGTYFLLVLGPRSLISEGGALWIALTWPQGLEALLKAKARLWWALSNVLVGAAFAAAVWFYPADAWRVALVAVGWWFFGRSLAEKAVTLVTAPSSSGEMERAPASRQWAAMLGTLAFGTGILTQSWHSAVLGVVFSSITAAAMWQNLRARLPHLYDPWSEKLPPAPTLMHAMIAIAIMVEVVAFVTGISYAAGGLESLWMARAIAYGGVGLLAFLLMGNFLARRDVRTRQVWFWDAQIITRRLGEPVFMLGGLAAGAVLGGLALLLLQLLTHLPWTAEYMRELAELQAKHAPDLAWLFILAVLVAPLTEEYFFRGLLFRALDREWGGFAAIAGSAAFFAIYHPPVSWLPVCALGMLNAWLYKKSGSLTPCVLTHMAYNAVVVLAGR